MIQIFYKDKGKIAISQSLVFLDELGMDDVIWIDLFSPDGDEKRAVETFLDTSLSSRAQAEEIESSSRYSETDYHLGQYQLLDSRTGRVFDGGGVLHSM